MLVMFTSNARTLGSQPATMMNHALINLLEGVEYSSPDRDATLLSPRLWVPVDGNSS